MLVACKVLVWSALLWQGAGAWMRVGASPRGSLTVLQSTHTALADISVFDGVLDGGDADTLSAFETSCAALGSSHWLYNRSLNKEVLGDVGTLLEQLLTSLQDDAPFVELWRREDWMNLDAHRDVDEVLARRTDDSYALRCPTHAHVLYIQVGQEVQGPTCLWLESAPTEPVQIDTLVTVPARSGRLLRFPGDAIHSVPRPPLCYLDPEEGGTNLEIFSRRRNELESSPELRRSVLLFNTWRTPPAEVRSLPPPPVREKETARSRLLRARQDWRVIPISAVPSKPKPTSQGPVHLKLGVLGDRRRRFAADNAWLHLYSQNSGVKAALEAKEAVYSTALVQNTTA